jgi:putative transcriptional regulator
MIHHHPADELLFDFATGAQAEALALAVATHLPFCPTCRATVAGLEAVGGALLRDLEPAAMSEGALTACLAELDAPVTNQASRPRLHRAPARTPEALRRYLGDDLTSIAWQSVGGFFDEMKLPALTPGYRVSMVRVAPGGHVPEHGHDGNEYMVVLAGSYRSGGRHYQLGDFSSCDGSEEHTPIADQGEDCICLLVLDGPLAFRDPDGWRISPLLTM